jgi:hypothetical protein
MCGDSIRTGLRERRQFERQELTVEQIVAPQRPAGGGKHGIGAGAAQCGQLFEQRVGRQRLSSPRERFGSRCGIFAGTRPLFFVSASKRSRSLTACCFSSSLSGFGCGRRDC